MIPLYNHSDYICDALDSLLRSTWIDWEAVVVDDASTDEGAGLVRGWIASHPDRSCLLIGHELNRGLGAARNSGVERARAPRLLMLDADNEVRPTTISRLSAALDHQPAASFAYGIMERFSASGPVGLLNAAGWGTRAAADRELHRRVRADPTRGARGRGRLLARP